MRDEISINSPLFEGKGIFAVPGRNVNDIIDFMEDMIIMIGCPDCNSLNTRLIIENDIRWVFCLECGTCEELPPVS